MPIIKSLSIPGLVCAHTEGTLAIFRDQDAVWKGL